MDISNTNGQPLIYVPLIMIVFVSMLKDFFEDFSRHKADKEENNRKTEVFENGNFVQKAWKELYIGDVIRVKQDTFIPADLLLLASSDQKGLAFVETKNLDGETNLKHKNVHKEFGITFSSERSLSTASNWFGYEKPNPFLYTFNGWIMVKQPENIEETKAALDNGNFILRGCSLRNTKWIIGIVAYSGYDFFFRHDTKIMLNSVKAKPKSSQVEKLMNKQIIGIFLFQVLCFIKFFLCCLCALLASLYFAYAKDNLRSYLVFTGSGLVTNAVVDFFVYLGIFFLLFSYFISFRNFVPISLLVTLETVKYIQGMMMAKDKNLCYLATETYATVQSSNLNEELGQVEYVFSDKTGTLTCNLMEYKNCCVGGVSFGTERNLTDISDRPEVTNVDFRDERFYREIRNKTELGYQISEFLEHLAICHSVITEEKNGKLHYNASSPDELALVNFAKFSNVTFEGSDEKNHILVQKNGEMQKFKLLHLLEFNSTRKRMSVIIEKENGEIELLTKGADSIIAERLNKEEKFIL